MCSLGATLNKTCQRPNALHIDELRGKGWVCGQLGELFQRLQASVDTVGLDPFQKLTSSTSLSDTRKNITFMISLLHPPIQTYVVLVVVFVLSVGFTYLNTDALSPYTFSAK